VRSTPPPPSLDVALRLERHAPGAGFESSADQLAAYGAAEVAFRFLVERYGDVGVRVVMARMSAGMPFAEAFQQATGTSVQDFERDLRRAMESDASPATSPG
jgi:hypothetical protein